MNSILYIHQKGDVALYVDNFSEAKKFRNFSAFADWYATVEKED